MPTKPNSEPKYASAAQALDAFITKMGAQAESALYTIICNRTHPARSSIDKGLAGGADSAMVAIAPHLMSEYKFSLMLATQVAAFAAQQVSVWGQGAVCAALTARRTRETVAHQPAKEKEPVPAPVAKVSLASLDDDDDEPVKPVVAARPAKPTVVVEEETPAAPVKRRPGRPKGSKNKKKTA